MQQGPTSITPYNHPQYWMMQQYEKVNPEQGSAFHIAVSILEQITADTRRIKLHSRWIIPTALSRPGENPGPNKGSSKHSQRAAPDQPRRNVFCKRAGFDFFFWCTCMGMLW